MNSEEYVVLVDKQNKILGTSPKLTIHNKNTPLHRAFSLFLFNPKGELLLQQRSSRKKAWPLVWSNSCCGHPMLGESNVTAARRRLKFELGINSNSFYEILPDFSYKAEMDGVVENEICPVIVSFTNKEPTINEDEVENIRWTKWNKFLEEINSKPDSYSIWCEREAKLLTKNKKFLNLYKKFVE
jgi:isopentenyl-diphosphate Delta-isomerase